MATLETLNPVWTNLSSQDKLLKVQRARLARIDFFVNAKNKTRKSKKTKKNLKSNLQLKDYVNSLTKQEARDFLKSIDKLNLRKDFPGKAK